MNWSWNGNGGKSGGGSGGRRGGDDRSLRNDLFHVKCLVNSRLVDEFQLALDEFLPSHDEFQSLDELEAVVGQTRLKVVCMLKCLLAIQNMGANVMTLHMKKVATE